MTISIGEKEEVKRVVKEILDVFSATSLEIEDNRDIVAETIARDLTYQKNEKE